ncbi:MAG: hypothetical protein NUW37_06320 [Planctomycetes bacterium]|nr:hypothetical protein [Planctomycetota bacterium]
MPTRMVLAFMVFSVSFFAACKHRDLRDNSVRVTVNDGQLLFGELAVPFVEIDTVLGPLRFSPEDIGELGPLEGSDMEISGSTIKLWLRDGSEYSGEWIDPEAKLICDVGGEKVEVPLPVEKLQRLQFTGSEIWPETRVVRVITTRNDDFLVNAENSRVELDNGMAIFRPTFAEISTMVKVEAPEPAEGEKSAESTEDKDQIWQINLESGMILKGKVNGDRLVFNLNVGPENIEVPVAVLQEIRQEYWDPYFDGDYAESDATASYGPPMQTMAGETAGAERRLSNQFEYRPEDEDSRYFSNQRFEWQKQQSE